MLNPVPFVDLAAQHAEVAGEIEAGFADVMADTAFINGPQVAEFERAFAAYVGAPACVGVGNGTDAIELALRAAEVGPGDECVLPANTFVATAEAVARCGARPVLVDCQPDSYLIDVAAVEQAITPRTKAILPVHLFGQPAEVEALRPLAARVGARIVEDAAQAHGARRHGAAAGALGDVAAFSFYPGKNLGGYGDAGAVLTADPVLAERVRLLRSHGEPRKYDHAVLGFNSRLDTLQAVVLLAKLARLDAWNAARAAAASRYDELLSGLDRVVLPATLPGNEHVWHLYVIRILDDDTDLSSGRDTVLNALRANGIGAGVHYPTPVHMTGAFGTLGYPVGSFPVAERAAGQILSLPMHPHLTAEQQKKVVSVVTEAL